MFNLINVSVNGAFVEVGEDKKIVLIENAFSVKDANTDEVISKNACEFLDSFTEVSQDWDREANVVEIHFENGKSAELVITAYGCEID